MNPDDYVGKDGLLRLHQDCRSLVIRQCDDAIYQLSNLMRTRASRTYEKHDVPRVVAAAIASHPKGIDHLIRLLPDASGHIYRLAIIETLWHIAEGFPVPHSVLDISYEPYAINERIGDLAREKLCELIVEAEHERVSFRVLAAMLGSHDDSVFPNSPEPGAFMRFFLESIRDSSIVLTNKILQEFEMLVQATSHEQKYQVFLEDNPVFIDPLAAEVINQAKLGTEFITDFVVRRHDYRYVVVEIEKPKDRIFTLKGDLSAPFTHAVGQVLDFQGWIAENITYAQKKLPWIENPRGLVIIGRRGGMSSEQEAKLRRWNTNSRNIEVLTYDDILSRAIILHRSLRRRGARTDEE